MKTHLHESFLISIRIVSLIGSLIFIWWLISFFNYIPAYLLPSPSAVIQALNINHQLLWQATLTTTQETIIGLVIGCFFGMFLALFMILVPFLRHWLMPIIIISQSIPTFALAPLLVLWFGFGISSKVVIFP